MDIRHKALRIGEPYLTAVQVGDMMNISTTMAQRAMNILAEKDILVRRRNAGTFVGMGLEGVDGVLVRTVHVLLPEDRDSTLVRTEPLLEGIRSVIHGAGVNFNFIPSGEEIRYVRELLDTKDAPRKTLGVVAIRGTREVYHYLARSGIPTVVFGTLWPGEPPLASINTDEHETGRLLTHYLIERSHRRMALLTGATGWPGDNEFFDGVSEALTKANLPHNAMITRMVPHDPAVFSAATRHLLELADRPTGIIVRGRKFADLVSDTAKQLGISSPDNLEIVFQDHATQEVEESPYPHVQPQISFADIAVQIGRMLNAISLHQSLEAQKVVVPVRLCSPARK